MKRTAVAMVMTAALLLGARVHADFQSLAAPGPLAKAHAAFEQSCDKCHVPFKGIPNTSCLACHTATQKRIASNVGTHAAFAREGKKCASCHKDHKGRGHAMSPPTMPCASDAISPACGAESVGSPNPMPPLLMLPWCSQSSGKYIVQLASTTAINSVI